MYANKTGRDSDVIGQQYNIEHPRALCTINNLPVKGQKSITTNFYQARYKESVVISHNLPHDWAPDSAILEGMFIIIMLYNTKPLHTHKLMQDYANFLIRKFIVPYFEKGFQDVHLLFDDPG